MEKYHENKTARDEEYVQAYLATHSQIKAAEMCGVGRETIARAVRRAGIPLNGRLNNGDHKGNYGGGSPRKITDAELIEESKTMTRDEIARKHNMHVCNIDRKLHRLGIKCVYSPKHFISNPKPKTHDKTWHFVKSQKVKFEKLQPGFEYVSTKGKRIKLKCRVCGETIERADSTVRQKNIECEHCKNERDLQETRQKLVGLLVAIEDAKTPKICRACGKEFYSPVPTKIYCSEACKRTNGTYRERCRHYGVYYDPDVTRMKVVKRDRGVCQICGKKCNPKDKRWGHFGPDAPTVDHIIPLAKGGTHTWDNVQCACAMCNSTKRDLLEGSTA